MEKQRWSIQAQPRLPSPAKAQTRLRNLTGDASAERPTSSPTPTPEVTQLPTREVTSCLPKASKHGFLYPSA